MHEGIDQETSPFKIVKDIQEENKSYALFYVKGINFFYGQWITR